jgi:plasmid stability protein
MAGSARILCSTVMKNITLKIDDETYRKARMRAASEGTSISAMVRDFLNQQANAEDERENRRIAALDELYRLADARGKARTAPLKALSREEIYAERVR